MQDPVQEYKKEKKKPQLKWFKTIKMRKAKKNTNGVKKNEIEKLWSTIKEHIPKQYADQNNMLTKTIC